MCGMWSEAVPVDELVHFLFYNFEWTNSNLETRGPSQMTSELSQNDFRIKYNE